MTPAERLEASRRRASTRARLRVVFPSDDGLEELEAAYAPVYGPPLVLSSEPIPDKKRRKKLVQERPVHKLAGMPHLPPEYVGAEHLRLYRSKRVSVLPYLPELPRKVLNLLPFFEEGLKTTPYHYQQNGRWCSVGWLELKRGLEEALRHKLHGWRDNTYMVWPLLRAGWTVEELNRNGVPVRTEKLDGVEYRWLEMER